MRRARTLLLASVRGFLDARCGLHAAGLTYFSLLSFVPVLCLSLLLAKACGVGDIARTEINRHLDAYITQIETMHDTAKFDGLVNFTRITFIAAQVQFTFPIRMAININGID